MIVVRFRAVCSFSLRMAFFYPIHYVGFIHLQDLSYAPATHSAVVHFDCQFSGFFRVFMPLRVNGIIFAALLTLAALAPRRVIPCLDLVLYFSAFRASFPCLFCSFSHISYYTTKSLFWTLPQNLSALCYRAISRSTAAISVCSQGSPGLPKGRWRLYRRSAAREDRDGRSRWWASGERAALPRPQDSHRCRIFRCRGYRYVSRFFSIENPELTSS